MLRCSLPKDVATMNHPDNMETQIIVESPQSLPPEAISQTPATVSQSQSALAVTPLQPSQIQASPTTTSTSLCTPAATTARNLLSELDANSTPTKVVDPGKLKETAAASSGEVPAVVDKKPQDEVFDVAKNEVGI